jgi:hypothetical protein
MRREYCGICRLDDQNQELRAEVERLQHVGQACGEQADHWAKKYRQAQAEVSRLTEERDEAHKGLAAIAAELNWHQIGASSAPWDGVLMSGAVRAEVGLRKQAEGALAEAFRERDRAVEAGIAALAETNTAKAKAEARVAALKGALWYIRLRGYTGAAYVAQDALDGKPLPDDEYGTRIRGWALAGEGGSQP